MDLVKSPSDKNNVSPINFATTFENITENNTFTQLLRYCIPTQGSIKIMNSKTVN